MQLFVALFAAVIGLAIAFFGYRFLWVLLPFWGFFAGLWLGITGLHTLFGEGFLVGVSGLVVGVVLGLIFAVLSYLFYFIGVAILGGSIGYGMTVSLLVGGLGMNPNFIVWIIAMVVAVLFAVVILALNIQKYAVIFITALGGASATIAGGLLLFGQVSMDQLSGNVGIFAPVSFQDGALWWIVWAVVAVAGIVWQIMTNRTYVLEAPSSPMSSSSM